MKILPVGQIRHVIEGNLVQGTDDLPIKSVTYKTQQRVPTNTLFFLPHTHPINYNVIRQALPCAVVVDHPYEALASLRGCTVIRVKNLRKAYFTFVDYYRNLFDIPVVAITGT